MKFTLALLAVLVFARVHGENQKTAQNLKITPYSSCPTGYVCGDSCATAFNGNCDDGGEYSQFSSCETGSDCKDCGVRVCSDTCQYSDDGKCDDGGDGSQTSLCEWGTDCTDCKGRAVWRADGRCGQNYPLPNGDPAECDPNKGDPCCSDLGWCGNTNAHCQCGGCTDYSVRKWREDGRCGSGYTLPDGSPAECNPYDPTSHCCSNFGWCGSTPDHCTCSGCTDFCAPESNPPPSGHNCDQLRIISRSEWGARAPRSRSFMTVPVDYTFIHHTVGNRCYSQNTCSTEMKNIQNYHMDSLGWSDIGYSFCIGEDGNAYEARGWGIAGAHTSGYNSVSHAISYMGNFDPVLPNESALNAGQQLIDCGLRDNYIKSNYRLLGHRDVGATACPGQQLYNEIRTWPRYG
ncbi:uncharacterized protein [Ptychodera flava]|uniref:uncharacterized protein n=1 Tax=Ptychodera flava TaxID=63121 RepID=UPI003969CC7E